MYILKSGHHPYCNVHYFYNLGWTHCDKFYLASYYTSYLVVVDLLFINTYALLSISLHSALNP